MTEDRQSCHRDLGFSLFEADRLIQPLFNYFHINIIKSNVASLQSVKVPRAKQQNSRGANVTHRNDKILSLVTSSIIKIAANITLQTPRLSSKANNNVCGKLAFPKLPK